MDKQLEQIYMLSKQELDKLNQEFEELNIECSELPKFIEVTQNNINDLNQKLIMKQKLLSKLETTYNQTLSDLKTMKTKLSSIDTDYISYQQKIITSKQQIEEINNDINIKTNKIKLLQEELDSCNNTLLQEQNKQLEITKTYMSKTDNIKEQIIKFNKDILTQINTSLFDCMKSFNQISITSHNHINLLDKTLNNIIFTNLPEEFITNLRNKYISLDFKKTYENYNTDITKMYLNIIELINNYDKYKDNLSNIKFCSDDSSIHKCPFNCIKQQHICHCDNLLYKYIFYFLLY
jgi:uncharacterized coiled-coil DUF342 family protein